MTLRNRLISLLAVPALIGAGLSALVGVPTAPAAAATSNPPGTGPLPGGSFLTFNLTDRLHALVNVGSGNLLVRGSDLVLSGIEGNVVLGADHNSLDIGSSIETGAFGHGWHSRAGIDVRLIANSDSTVTFTSPDGVVGVFKPITGTSPTQYTSPVPGRLAETRLTGAGRHERTGNPRPGPAYRAVGQQGVRRGRDVVGAAACWVPLVTGADAARATT